jgi:2-keto-3-deoxy-galactonokinase
MGTAGTVKLLLCSKKKEGYRGIQKEGVREVLKRTLEKEGVSSSQPSLLSQSS